MASTFPNKKFARAYLELPCDNFVAERDLELIKQSGVSLSHWILGYVFPEEPYVDRGCPYFVRMAKWAEEIGLEVWPDVHTAPG